MHRGITEKKQQKQIPKEAERFESLYTILIKGGEWARVLVHTRTHTRMETMVHSALRNCDVMKSPQHKHFSKGCSSELNQIVSVILAFSID